METTNMDVLVRLALTQAIKESGLTREQIAEEVTTQSGVMLTKGMLDAYTAPSRVDYKLPFVVAPFFDLVTKSYALGDLYAQARNVRFLTASQTLELELEDIQGQIKHLKQRAKKIKTMLEANHGMV